MRETRRDQVPDKIQAAIDFCKTPVRDPQEAIDNKITGGLLQEVLDNHNQRRASRSEIPPSSFRPRIPLRPRPEPRNPSPRS